MNFVLVLEDLKHHLDSTKALREVKFLILGKISKHNIYFCYTFYSKKESKQVLGRKKSYKNLKR